MLRLPSYPASRLDYELPLDLIAQQPAPLRRDARLLHVDVAGGKFTDRSFSDLPALLPADTHIIMNNSRVIPARLCGTRSSGGRVEILYHSSEDDGQSRVLMKSRARLAAGETLLLPDNWSCTLCEAKRLDGSLVRICTAAGKTATPAELHDFLGRHGVMPLPPYIRRDQSDKTEPSRDRERYQTVYAQDSGSVAAPTAGLHFDNEMLAQLRGGGHTLDFVTLHVGLGTFSPLRVDDLAQHSMHSEDFSVSAQLLRDYTASRSSGRTIMAVGTTSVRVLHTIIESRLAAAPDDTALHGSTRAFIYPGRPTVACDLLLTNFHLPRSSLLALVYSFGGEDLMQAVYNHAVRERYRFFSYGDCMLIDKRRTRP